MYGKKGSDSPNSKRVICLNNKKVFDCIKLAAKELGLKNASGISYCCKGKRQSAGKVNGEPAKWMYYDEYIKNQNN